LRGHSGDYKQVEYPTADTEVLHSRHTGDEHYDIAEVESYVPWLKEHADIGRVEGVQGGARVSPSFPAVCQPLGQRAPLTALE